MNSKRIARRIIAGEKPVHWVTLAARRVLAGEDFNLVMQDLAKDMGLYDTSRFNAVERELKARVEQERTARKISAKLLTPVEAAEDLAIKLKTEYGVDARAWDSEKLVETGWTTADAAVACEGVDISEEQLYERGPFKGGTQPYEGLFLEPYSTWLMCIYQDNV